MSVPSSLQNSAFRFCLVNGKRPLEKDWPRTANYPYFHPKLCLHQYQGGNYAVLGGYGNLLVLDFDNIEAQSEIMPQLPPTFTVMSGGKGLNHVYFTTDNADSWKILDAEGKTILDAQGVGRCVVGPGSTHPDTGRRYVVWNGAPIAFIGAKKLKEFFAKYAAPAGGELVIAEKKIGEKPSELTNKLALKVLKHGVTMPDLLQHYAIPINVNPTKCPFHTSVKGRCFSFTDSLWHCFHCERGGHIADFIKLAEEIRA